MSLITENGRDPQFRTTHWTLVRAAARTQSPEAERALEALCRSYWYPLYAFARRRGASPHDAEDLTQSFFAGRVATKLVLQGIDSKQGKFRTWLLTSFQNFINNEHARQHAQKRGGDVSLVSLDISSGEDRFVAEPGCDATPEQFYDRTWGMTILDKALAQLQSSYETKGEPRIYQELANHLPGARSSCGYAETAARLGMTQAAVKMRVSRLKQELGRLLQAEVKKTVASAGEAREELRYLISILGT